MENIKQSIANIRKHLQSKIDSFNYYKDPVVLALKEFKEIMFILDMCIDSKETIVGVGFKNYSSEKDFKEFPENTLKQKGFLLESD